MRQPATTHADVAELAAAALARLRARAPRVHCITNTVAQNFTANALLALACVPSMTLSADEIAGFVVGADSLLVNLGTFDAERRAAVEAALDAAAGKAAPWVLDPVFIDRSAARAQFARSLLMRGARGGAAQRGGIFSAGQRQASASAGRIRACQWHRGCNLRRDRSRHRRRTQR